MTLFCGHHGNHLAIVLLEYRRAVFEAGAANKRKYMRKFSQLLCANNFCRSRWHVASSPLMSFNFLPIFFSNIPVASSKKFPRFPSITFSGARVKLTPTGLPQKRAIWLYVSRLTLASAILIPTNRTASQKNEQRNPRRVASNHAANKPGNFKFQNPSCPFTLYLCDGFGR